jgi:trigger factor
MENVIREDLDQLNAVLTVQVPRSSYKATFESKIRDFRRKAQIKGFRKGHTPETLVRKMYGEALLAEVVQEEINRRLQEYLEAEKPNFFGEPLITEEQDALRFDISELPDYQVRFELGLIPEFELRGLGTSTSISLPRVRVSEEEIDKHIAMLRRRHGQREEIAEGQVQEMDQVELHLEEWENDQKKEGGVHAHTTFLVNELMVDALREKLLGKTIKDTVRFDPYQAEKNADEATVRKYILHLEEDAPATSRDFLGRIDKIVRVTPADLDQAFYDQAFGPGQIADEAAMRELVRGQLEQSFAEPVREFVQVLMKVSLLESNTIPLPEAFLRRWVTTRAREANETEDWDDEKLRRFYLDLRWSLIRDKVLEIGQVEVTDQDILEEYKKKLREYFGGSADEALLDQLAPRALSDKEFRGKLTDQVLRDKLAGVYLQQVSLDQEDIAPDNFREWMDKAYQEVEKRFLAL